MKKITHMLSVSKKSLTAQYNEISVSRQHFNKPELPFWLELCIWKVTCSQIVSESWTTGRHFQTLVIIWKKKTKPNWILNLAHDELSSLKHNARSNYQEIPMKKAEKPFCFIRLEADLKKNFGITTFYLYHLKTECSALDFSLKTQKNRKSI